MTADDELDPNDTWLPVQMGALVLSGIDSEGGHRLVGLRIVAERGNGTDGESDLTYVFDQDAAVALLASMIGACQHTFGRASMIEAMARATIGE